MSEVESGRYYWVKLDGDWDPAWWDGTYFKTPFEDFLRKEDLEAIGPRIEKPEGLGDE